MSDKDYIKELFSEKLGGYEAKVDPKLWSNISSQIGVVGAGTTTGLTVAAKWLIGIVVSTATVVTAVIVVNSFEDQQDKKVAEDQQTNIEQEPVVKENKPEENIVDEQIINVDNSETIAVLQNESPASAQEESAVKTEAQETQEEHNKPAVNKGVNHEEEKTEENNQGAANNEQPSSDKEVVNKEQENKTVKPETVLEVPEAFEEEVVKNESKDYSIGQLPNVFTPNNDGENDYFRIESENLTGFAITILNEQNKIVYQSSNPDFVWDGKDSAGNPVPDGRYVYFITAKEFSNDKPRRYSPLFIQR